MLHLEISSIHHPAVASDLAICSSERADIAHLHHSSSEISEKQGIISTIGPNQSILRPTVEQLLVWMEKPTLSHKVLVVIVIKLVHGLYIKGGQVGVSAWNWACRSSGGSKVGVDIGVVVDAGAESEALSLAYGMATWQSGHIIGI